jgi:hypothetical protein
MIHFASPPCQSEPISTIVAVQDYAGAWATERGRCHRFVYTEEDGRPTDCPAPPVRSGWRRGSKLALGDAESLLRVTYLSIGVLHSDLGIS